MTAKRRFVLRDGDAFVYYFDKNDLGSRASKIADIVIYADDVRMELLQGTDYQGGWFAADHRATRITVEDPARKVVDHYALRDPSAASVKYPAALTPEQWDGLGRDDTRWNLYETVHREQPPVRVELAVDTGDWIELDGTPPQPEPLDTPAWVPDLLPGLANRPEYHHLLPGYIPGLPAHIGQILERRLGTFRVSWDRDGRGGWVRAEVLVPFEQPVTRFVPNVSSRTGKTLRGGKKEQRTVTRTLHLPIPQRVHGETYAAAAEVWRGQVEYWIGVVEAARSGSAKACNHCEGLGFVGGDVFTEFDVPKGVWP